MSNEMEHQDAIDKVRETLRALDAVKNTIISPQMQQLVQTAQMVNNAVISMVQSEAMQAALEVSRKVAELVKSFDFTPVLKKFSEAMIPIRYVYLLERLKWPVFLIDDESLRQNIMDACKQSDDFDAVRGIILSYCGEGFLNAVECDWNACDALKVERKPILSEALTLYKLGYYNATTSMLMCQVYGIASDIVDIAKRNGLVLDQEAKAFVAENFEIKLEDIDKEKGRLLQLTAMTESGYLLWEAMANYLKNEILCSSDSKKRWESQPLRNKICHGDQLNFGTQEHSIKAILTIDMLVQLAYEIDRIAKKANEYSIDGKNETEEAQ